MAENPQTPLGRPAFHFQHLSLFEFGQSRMSQVKRNGDAGHSVGSKPLIREPEMWTKLQAMFLQFSTQFCDRLFDKTGLQSDVQIAHG